MKRELIHYFISCCLLFSQIAATANQFITYSDIFGIPVKSVSENINRVSQDPAPAKLPLDAERLNKKTSHLLQFGPTDDDDNDGVQNQNDIDDDNDGVPDATESPSCFYTAGEWNTAAKPVNAVAITSGLTTTTGNFGQLTDGVGDVTAVTFSNTPAQPIQNANVYLFTFTNPVRLDAVYLGFNTATQFAGTTKIQGSNTNNGTDWVDLSAAISQTAGTNTTAGGSVTVTNSIKYPVTLNTSTAYKYIRITGEAASDILAENASEVYFDFNTSAYVASRYPKANCTDANIDGDGILPQFDPDSDGDGCSDAFEAGATTNTAANYQFPDVDGNNDGLVDEVDTDGNGVVDYRSSHENYSQNANVKTCVDTDGDGIRDITDIDDDNDGVPDQAEMDCSVNDFLNLTNGLSGTQNMDTWLNTYGVRIRHIETTNFTANTTIFSIIGHTSWPGFGDVDNKMIYDGGGVSFSFYMPDGTTKTTKSFVSIFSDPAPSGSVRVIARNINGDIILNRIDPDGQEHRVTTADTGGELIHELVVANSSSAFDILSFNGECTDKDTDNDGIVNRLDLDSDGDSCPDAVEAGVSSNAGASGSMSASGGSLYSGGVAPGTPNAYVGNGTPAQYGANGYFNGIETGSESGSYNGASTYSQYALSSSVNACTDTDGDNITDIVDIDDDNDGIIDSEEISCTISNTAKTGVTVTKPSTINYTFSGSQTLANLVDGTDANTLVITSPAGELNDEWFRVEFASPKVLTEWEVGHFSGQALFSTTSTYKVQGSQDGNIWMDLTGTLTYANNRPGQSTQPGSNIANFPQNATAYKYYRYVGISATVGSGWATEFYFKEKTCTDFDTDGDNIPNRLDLDSDGDGCPDAVEAGVSTNAGASGSMSPSGGAVYSGGIAPGTANAYAGNGTPAQYGANGYFNGIETGAESGAYNGTSTYSPYALSTTLNACKDTDGDGAGDLEDIDDDNDGILDAVESSGCFYAASEIAIPKSVTTQAANTGNIANIHDNNAGTTFGFTNGSSTSNLTVLEAELQYPVKATAFEMEMSTSGQTIFSNTDNSLRIEGWNGSAWVTLLPDFNPSSSPHTASGFHQTFTFTQNQSVAYSKFRLAGISTNGTVNSNQFWGIKLVPADDYNPSLYPKPACVSDADDDTVPNHLDLDSDGDGCPDAVEAGVSLNAGASGSMSPSGGSVYSGGIPSGTANAYVGNGTTAQYGANGYFNGIETSAESGVYNGTSTYIPYALDKDQSTCVDSDGDGVNDIVDIDDDNDGIIDDDERNCVENNASKPGITVSKPETIDYRLDGGQTLANLVDGTDANDYVIFNPTGTLNSEWFRVEFPTPKILTRWEVGHYSGQTLFSTSSTYKVQGSQDGSNWTDLTSTLTYSNNQSGQSSQANSNIADFAQNNAAYKYYRYVGIAATAGNGWATEFYFREKNCTDTDADGDSIPNRLDLDSDGDGCSDAIEGGANDAADPVKVNNLVHSGMPGGNKNSPGYTGTSNPVDYNLGNTVDANGVPTIVSGGQVPGISQNASAKPDNCFPAAPPVAQSDMTGNNSPGSPASVNVTTNDTGGDPVNAGSVSLVVPSGSTCEETDSDGDCVKRTVPNEGVWTVSPAGVVTFTPASGFTKDPAPVNYTVKDNESESSSTASVSADYVPRTSDDSGAGTTGNPVTVSVVSNDTGGDTVDPSTVQIAGTSGAGVSRVVPGEGTWSVNTTTGAITFTPETGFTGNPTPITYTVKDGQSNTSNASAVRVTFAPLPVTLAAFSASEVAEGVLLKWSTVDEKDFDRFEVEYSASPQTIAFVKLAVVKGGGANYRYVDSRKLTGGRYYRLKMVDLDGTFDYSRIVTITSRNGIELNKVYPNPSDGHLVRIATNGVVESLSVFDASGRSMPMQLSGTNGFYEIRLGKDLAPGLYLITYSVNGEQFNSKFVLRE